MSNASTVRAGRTLRKTLTALLLLAPAALRAEGNFPPDAPLSADVCMTCHGGYGQGSEVVGGPKLAGMEPWYLKRQLLGFRNGYRGIEKDYIQAYEMRATALALSDGEIDNVVAEIQAWPDVDVPATITGDAAKGAALYGTCAACHGADAKGNEALGAPALANRNDWYLKQQLELFTKGYRGAHSDDTAGQQMRAIISTVSYAAAQDDILAYLNSLD